MKVWIKVPAKTIETSRGPTRAPDYPTYYQVKYPENADGTFDVLVDDPSAKPK